MNSTIVIDNIVYPGQIMGGISLVFYELTKRLLQDNRFEVSFVDRKDSKINYYYNLLGIKESQIISYSKLPYVLDCFMNPKLFIKNKYIFHSSYYRLSRDSNAINVTTVHDFTYEHVFKKNIKYYAHVWQQEWAVRHSEAIICISENTKKDLFHYYKNIDPNKVFVVYNGVSEEYRVLNNFDTHKLPFEKGTYCVFVGGRYHYKNFDYAVKSVAKTNMNLVIVGSKLTGEECQFLNTELGETRYSILSNIPNKELNIIYNGAHCLLYLSSYEGFGIPCVEAQKAGCPVIAYNASSIPEVVCDASLLVDDLDPVVISRKINELSDLEYRQNIIDKGIAFAKKFSWDRNYEQISEIYKKLLARR